MVSPAKSYVRLIVIISSPMSSFLATVVAVSVAVVGAGLGSGGISLIAFEEGEVGSSSPFGANLAVDALGLVVGVELVMLAHRASTSTVAADTSAAAFFSLPL